MWTQITCLANPNDEQGIPNPMRNTHGNTVNGGGGRRCRRHPSPCDSQVRKFRVRPTHLCAGSSHIARSCTEGASEGLGDAALRIIRKHFIISNSANAKQDRPS